MFKTFVTLMRGSAAAAAEDLADANALLILDQQIRDAQAALAKARRALALALAEDSQEARGLAALGERLSTLEQRARAALAGGRADLAAEAAEAIAGLETERAAADQARNLFGSEIARMRRHLSDAEARLAALQRGRRLARVAEALRIAQRGRVEAATPAQATLSDAEATLARLHARQTRATAALEALDGLEAASRPAGLEARLAAAGFGPALQPSAASVLARLKQA